MIFKAVMLDSSNNLKPSESHEISDPLKVKAKFLQTVVQYLEEIGPNDFCIGDLRWSLVPDSRTKTTSFRLFLDSAFSPRIRLSVTAELAASTALVGMVSDMAKSLSTQLLLSGRGFLIGGKLVEHLDASPLFSVSVAGERVIDSIPDYAGFQSEIMRWLSRNNFTTNDIKERWLPDVVIPVGVEIGLYSSQRLSPFKVSIKSDPLSTGVIGSLIEEIHLLNEIANKWKESRCLPLLKEIDFLSWHRIAFAGERRDHTPVDRVLLLKLFVGLGQKNFFEEMGLTLDQYERLMSTGIGSKSIVNGFYDALDRRYPGLRYTAPHELDRWSEMAHEESKKTLADGSLLGLFLSR